MSESAQEGDVGKSWPAMSIAEANRIITAPGMPCEMEELVIRGVPTRVWKNAAAVAALGGRGVAGARREDLPGPRGRAGQLRGLLPRRRRVRARTGPGRRRQGRPGRDHHAQHPRMAGGLLRRRRAGGDPHAAERLVDRAGTGIRPDRQRDQGRHRRRRAAGADQRAPGALPRPEAGLCRPLPRGDRQPADRQAGGRDRRAELVEGPAGPRPAAGRDPARGRRHHLLHLRHHRKAEGGAGHPAQHQLQHHGRRQRRPSARSCAAARPRQRRIRTRRSARCCSRCRSSTPPAASRC